MENNFNIVSYPGKINIPYNNLYAPKFFGRVSLPHRDPKCTTYLRKDNEYIFTIETGYEYIAKSDSLKPYGIPFGIYPRLLLLLITSYAIYEQKREIIMSENITEFMSSLGYDLTGGDSGSMARLNNQLNRLLNCRISFQRNTKSQNGSVKKTKNYINQISKIELWESNKEIGEGNKIKAVISESFYNWIQETAYPVDRKTVEAMRSSLLKLDLYLFLCSRTYRINPNKYDTYISWTSLEKQLGTNYKETKEFARHARKAITSITEWYPELKASFKRGRLIIGSTSQPHIKSYPQK